jgi:hypothetical protein
MLNHQLLSRLREQEQSYLKSLHRHPRDHGKREYSIFPNPPAQIELFSVLTYTFTLKDERTAG